MGWKNAKEHVDRYSGGKFLRMKGGQKVRVSMLSRPHVKFTVWQDNGTVQVEPGTTGARPRYVLAVYNHDTKQPQYWELAPKLFRAVLDELPEDVYGAVLTVKRTGDTKDDTTYSVLQTGTLDERTRAIVDAERAAIGSADIEDATGAVPLEDDDDDEPAAPATPPKARKQAAEADEDIPF